MPTKKTRRAAAEDAAAHLVVLTDTATSSPCLIARVFVDVLRLGRDMVAEGGIGCTARLPFLPNRPTTRRSNGSKGHGKLSTHVVYLAFDPARPALSAKEVAEAVWELAAAANAPSAGAPPLSSSSSSNGNRASVLLDLRGVPPGHHIALSGAVARHGYAFRAAPAFQGAKMVAAVHVRSNAFASSPRALLLQGERPNVMARAARTLQAALRAADLENQPANLLTPMSMATQLRAWLTGVGARVRVMDAAAVQRAGMGLVMAVGQGAARGREPCVLVAEVPDGRGELHEPTLLVGKGVVYDSGGLSLKPVHHMYGMHGDKSGAAVVAAVARLLVEEREVPEGGLLLVLPLVENAVSSTAIRPGDVVRACDGRTVEIVDPDAEGRLIMADALAYGARYSPRRAIDVATLTGWSTMVACDLAACYFSRNDALASLLEAAGEAAGERVWRLPKWTEYAELTRSRVADLRNSGGPCGMCDGYMAALFLSNFVPPSVGADWLHIDIARNTRTGSSPADDVFTATGVLLCSQLFRRLQPRRG